MSSQDTVAKALNSRQGHSNKEGEKPHPLRRTLSPLTCRVDYLMSSSELSAGEGLVGQWELLLSIVDRHEHCQDLCC